jgi:hypothetical protein
MTNYELLLRMNSKAKENIDKIQSLGQMDEISKCIAFTGDLQKWISKCGSFSALPLVIEAQDKCVSSIFLCAQGFYKASISSLRQCMEHMLFAVLLSTNDYQYKLWVAGQCDMSWAQTTDSNNGVFGTRFIQMYAMDLEERSTELLTLAKNTYRECSEYIHGNYGKLTMLSEKMEFEATGLRCFLDYFDNVRYLICMALLIRFRHVLDDKDVVQELEPVIMGNLQTLPEVQDIYNRVNEG